MELTEIEKRALNDSTILPIIREKCNIYEVRYASLALSTHMYPT